MKPSEVAAALIGNVLPFTVPPLWGDSRRRDTNQDLVFKVHVKDARLAFGRIDVLIAPVDGGGEQWVTAERCGVTLNRKDTE